MSSESSTVIIKKPKSILRNIKRNSSFRFCMSSIFWLCCGLLNAELTDISPSIQGVSVSFRAEETILSVLSTVFLLYGLRKGNYNWAIFWILLTAWYLYDMQYFYMKNMIKTLQITDDIPATAWIAFTFHSIGLVLKAMLVGRMGLQVFKQWNAGKAD